MNAAARLLHKNVISRSWVISVLLSKAEMSLVVLISAVLISALSVIYVSNSTRSLNADIQQTLNERNQLHVQWSQLLLEKGTWIMQARVQHLAQEEMNMVVPEGKSVVIVNE